MMLDNEDQRKFLLSVIEGVSFPGSVLEMAFFTKRAIQQATVQPPLPLREAEPGPSV